jgi:3-methyl-2-oxobutanoate hydroxymethyltransferase
MHDITITTLNDMKQRGEKIAVLTSYDASFTRQAEEAGVDVLLVGDSLGMVVQGHESTLPVTLEEMVYHTANVSRASRRALIMADMPFMSHNDPLQALQSAGALMKQGGAHMVKVEGGAPQLEVVRALTERGVPVCSHLGLLPQSVNQLGGYRVQGREPHDATRMLEDAVAMTEAGAQMLLLECVPSVLAAEITRQVAVPVIGIGAGPDTDAQVLVIYDMLGITPGKRPKFSRDFLAEAGTIPAALAAYVRAVKDGSFPDGGHSFA